jgi:2-amino-4-hydroxy-6-hydroxymethyldihydropteridine diphosphokinase
MSTVYLSLGSNLGDRAANLESALKRLQNESVRLLAVSSLYETEPIQETATPVPRYLNLAARVETSLTPLEFLAHCRHVEEMGARVRTTRWASRTIDIDILQFDSVVMQTEELTIPHPEMFARAFVLVPLAEIAPNLTFPDSTTIQQRLSDPIVQSQDVQMYGAKDESLNA